MENSKIEWCDHTANFWSGCTKKSPACAHCYAEVLALRAPKTLGCWGPGAPRRDHRGSATKNVMKWQRRAKLDRVCSNGHPYPGTYENLAHGKCYQCGERWEDMPKPRPRVFVNSLSDWLDEEVPVEWLANLLDVIRVCPDLDFLLLTKRPENFHRLLDRAQNPFGGKRAWDPPDLAKWIIDWIEGCPPPNAWIGTTVEDQARAAERIPLLLRIPASVRFLSCEPLLEPIDLSPLQVGEGSLLHVATGSRMAGIHWIICGGESGSKRRPFHADWARSLRDQSSKCGVAFFMKQMTGLRSGLMEPIPEDLFIREFPTTNHAVK